MEPDVFSWGYFSEFWNSLILAGFELFIAVMTLLVLLWPVFVVGTLCMVILVASAAFYGLSQDGEVGESH